MLRQADTKSAIDIWSRASAEGGDRQFIIRSFPFTVPATGQNRAWFQKAAVMINGILSEDLNRLRLALWRSR